MRIFSITALITAILTPQILGNSEMLVPVTPSLSPDGSKFAFSWHADIWIADINGGEAQRITNHPSREIHPLFSRDGKTLYFNSDREGSLQVWKLDLMKRGKPTQITKHSEVTIIEDITPDDQNLIVKAHREYTGVSPTRFYYQDIKGEKAEKIIFDGYGDDPKISPDGKKILFVREGSGTYRKGYHGSQAAQIWLYDIYSGEFTQPVRSNYGVQSPMWMPNSQGFYYANSQSGTSNLHKFSLVNGEDVPLTHYKDDGILSPVISNDGSTILFRKLFHYFKYNTNETDEPQIINLHHTEDLEIQREKDLKIKTTSDADFSESGLEIIFTANDDIYAMDTVLREPNCLTNTFTREYNLIFSPNSKNVYFIEDDGITTKICSLSKKDPSKFWWDSENFEKQVIIDTKETITTFDISPDGKQIAYTTTNGRLWVASNSGQNSRVLISSWDTPSFQWSPDSEWITYAVSNDNFNSDVFITRIDGSQEPVNISQHPDNDFSPTFSPDGKKIAFVGRRYGTTYDLYVVDLTTIGSEKSERAKRIEDARKAMKKDPAYQKKSNKNKKQSKPSKSEQPEPKNAEPAPKADPKQPNPILIDPNAQPDPKKIPTNAPPANKQPQQATEPKQDEVNPITSPQEEDEEKTDEEQASNSDKPKPKKPKKNKIAYDLTDIQKRIERIKMKFGNPSSIIWTKDSKNILFQTSSSKSIYTVAAKEGATAKEYSKTKVRPIRMNDKGKLFCIANGIPSVMTSGKVSKYPFTTYSTQSRIDHQRQVFRNIWRTMRDGFYDENLNGKNWDGMLTKYENAAANATSMQAFDRVIAMLLGELNASHTGFRSKPWQTRWKKQTTYRKEVAHLGVLFDDKHSGEGWRIKEVLPTGPADQLRSKLKKDEIILKINGIEINQETSKSDVLLGRITDEITLTVQKNNDTETREVKIQPISYNVARSLIAENNIEKTREYIEKISYGRLGYIHIARMMWDEFEQFERHLYENGAGKDGIVIDVRNNGGGFTTDHLLTVLTQPRHAYTIPRNGGPGYPQDRFVYATWDKPIVVLCNQNSFSNAEIFTHAIKSLNRGKVVGISTAGGVISAGQVNILGSGNLRYPFRGWFSIDSGKDMELNGARPDYPIWHKPTQISSGIDLQAEKAVEVLMQEIKNKKTEFPKPLYRHQQP